MSLIISAPKSNLIEHVAGQLAATWYEIGRSQGMTSKWKTPRAYARANIEKFLPKAIEHLIDILGNPSFPDLAKQEILEALLERHNDPTLKTGNELPNIDMKKLMAVIESNKGGPSTQANLSLAQKINNAVKHNPFKKVN